MTTPWLIYEAKRTGKSIAQIKEEMSTKSKLVDPKKRGLAGNPEAAKLAADKRWAKHRANKLGGGAEG